jgi:prepilin peptidase CpaA
MQPMMTGPTDPLSLTWYWPTQWTQAYSIHLATLIPMFVAMSLAAGIDWRSRRIPNWLTFSLAGAGLIRAMILWIATDAGSAVAFTPLDAVLGLLAGFGVSVPLFALGARGAGDAKLYMAIGTWVGWPGVVALFLIEAVVGAALVVARAIWTGQLMQLLTNTGVLVMTVLHIRRVGVAQAVANGQRFTIYGATTPDDTTGPRVTSFDKPLPHAVPLLAAALLAVLMGRI